MKEVTLMGLNREFARALFSRNSFWVSLLFYIVGLISLWSFPLIGGIIMFIAALSMLNSDWNGRAEVVKRLRWVK